MEDKGREETKRERKGKEKENVRTVVAIACIGGLGLNLGSCGIYQPKSRIKVTETGCKRHVNGCIWNIEVKKQYGASGNVAGECLATLDREVPVGRVSEQ